MIKPIFHEFLDCCDGYHVGVTLTTEIGLHNQPVITFALCPGDSLIDRGDSILLSLEEAVKVRDLLTAAIEAGEKFKNPGA